MALGKYEILCRLSTGGMSEIFLAYQRGFGGFRKIVVLKTILPDTRGQEDMVRMFLNEARVTAEFSHPNIVQVYDLGIDKDMLFLSMEYVQGCNVMEMVRACYATEQSLPMGFSLATVRDTALALSYAHSFVDMRHRKRPIIHRDVAGKNIMVTYEGTTKLLDFGIAKMHGADSLTFAGIVKGTTGYMSPEQLLGKPLDGRSDIFSLGIVLHECLTGYRLFHETKKTAVLKNEIHAPSSINPQVPSAVDDVVMKALERNPDKRFQCAREFARALEEAAKEHMWRAEQVGHLVSEHFSQRREHTRRLIEEVQARLNDFTGQIHVEDFVTQPPFEKALPCCNRLFEKKEENGMQGQPTDENTSPSLSLPPPEVELSSPPPPGRSALIPIPLPPPLKALAPPASFSHTEKTGAHDNTLLHRFFSHGYFALVCVSLLLGVILAVLLFWIFTGFGPSG